MADTTFYGRLKKLFSSKAIITVDSDGNRKVIDHDDKQQTNLSSLRDRYTKLQRSVYEQAGGAHSMAYQQVRREVFRDYDVMDNDPIIASALDIYADECITGDTIIPLLDGRRVSIKELYDAGETDIWLYGLDSENKFKPVKADKIAYNGKKQVKELIFDDGTKIKCTDNHIWIKPDGSEISTCDIKIGESILALPTKKSDHKNNVNNTTVRRTVISMGYNGINEFAESINHKVVSIKNVGIDDVYDVVNAGDNHVYAVESNDGSKLYTHNCTLKNELGDVIVIQSDNERVHNLLDNLFYDVLNIEFNLWPWVRNLCKYGDLFITMEISEGLGIINVTPQSVYGVERLERTDPSNPNSVKFKVEFDIDNKGDYENYEVAHFRLLSDSNWLPYGKSMIENGRRLWKQLSLMEDAMLIHRIMRAPEKRIFSIDIGNIAPNEVDNYMQRIISKMKKVPFLNKNTGDYNLKYNMQNLTEDFYLPVRGKDSGTRIENLAGLDYSAIEDIDYLKNKLFAALKVPRAYLGYEENVCVVPETEIPLLNGTIKTIAELIEDYNNGVQNYVYSINEDKDIVPGKIEWAGMTRESAELVRVWLDNGKYIDCTPDHNFMTRDGLWVEAKDLTENQSLMPLYLSNGGYKDNYTTVYNPRTGDYILVHNIVYNFYNIRENKKVIHHADFNSRNNNPDNLDGTMTFWEHRKYHSNLIEKTLNSTENINKRINDPEWILSTKLGGRKGGLKSGKKLGEWIKTHGPANKGNKSGVFKKCPTCNTEFYRNDSSSKIYCSKKCNVNPKYNTKYDKITKDELISLASTQISFSGLESVLGIDRNTLNRIFKLHDIDKVEFINNHMPLALENKGFINNFPTLNHTVSKIEFLVERRDTADLRISDHHNFATNAGVIIHNSGKATLAAEDVRFARTIERIQRMMVSELTKMAVIHLYSNGITDAEMANFELHLVNPSTIYEQEKVNLWTEKIRLAADIKALDMLSKDWIYENIFKLTNRDKDNEKLKILDDLKDTYRYESIKTDGNDPAVQVEPTDVENSLNNIKQEFKDKGGRPREGNTYGKDRHPYGRDPLGDKERTSAMSGRTSESKAKSYISGIASKKKVLNEKLDMLDESQIMDDI